MERVDFCLDSKYLLTYRAAITVWDVPLALKVTEAHENNRGSVNWRIELDNWYSSDYSIQLHYTPQKVLFAHIREEVPKGRCTIQTFNEAGGVAQKFSFQSSSEIQTTKWGPQWTTDGKSYATEDVILDVSASGMIKGSKKIDLLRPRQILAAATHLNRGLMACVQPGDISGFSLQLYDISTERLLTSIESRAELPLGGCVDALVLFDVADVPTFILVLTAQTDSSEGRFNDTSSNTDTAPWSVWLFALPTLTLQNTFPVAGSPAVRTPYTRLTGLFAEDGATAICIQESKHSVSCGLWLINVPRSMWIMQYFSNCWLLSYVPSRGTIVALTADGWLQCKLVADIEADVIKHGKGRQTFDARDETWIWAGWRKLLYLPPSYLPCYESNLAVHENGELAYVDEYGKQLVQISFHW
jgi:hypothetical protein